MTKQRITYDNPLGKAVVRARSIEKLAQVLGTTVITVKSWLRGDREPTMMKRLMIEAYAKGELNDETNTK